MAKNDKDFAVVVGVSHYEGLKPLKGPDTDAAAFRDWLLSEEGGNIPEENCKFLVSKETPLIPLQDDIDRRFGEILKALRDATGTGRRLYFYFSGHGLGITWDETALALPPWSDIMRNYALSSTSYLNTLIECGFFEEVFFFLDCCRNRIPGTTGAKPLFGNVKPAQGTAYCDSLVCYSTEFDNAAYEAEMVTSKDGVLDNNLVRGLFTVALISGLKGAAARNGQVTIMSLMEYLQSYLPELAKQQQKKQVPRFINNSRVPDKPITGKLTLTDIDVTISFSRPAQMVVLEDPNLNILWTGSTDAGPQAFKLKRGNYCMRYEHNDADMKTIRIDGTQNPFNYEF
ncbi:caspase family protein [Chitinophaga sp. MM2321]|uniref:caspase family protein n=1 Tax=Chitinophaga sp. MM2321 TaxID=3137178 RepID=UPI0032D57B2A